MKIRIPIAVAVVTALLALPACSPSPTDPGLVVGDSVRTVLLGDSVEIRLELSETSIPYGGRLVATARITNSTDRAVVLTSSCTALLEFPVSRGGEPYAFEGSIDGCGFAITEFTLAPGAEITETRELRAVRGGEPVPPGVYSVQLDLLVNARPDVELPIEVRGPLEG